MVKTALVLGSSGLIGSRLVDFLKDKGYYVTGVDANIPREGHANYDEFHQMDLTIQSNVSRAMRGQDEVYQLAAEVGGIGYIITTGISSLHTSNLINTYVAREWAGNVGQKLFFSSSVCVYPDKKDEIYESDVFPAYPNEGYGWEKLVSEIRYLEYSAETDNHLRIARFGTVYGPGMAYEGGREKVPAALCRKAIESDKELEVWGDGKAVRSFMHVDDCVRGIYALMQSRLIGAVNIGSDNYLSINEFANKVIKVSGKNLKIKHVSGPVGANIRKINHDRIKSIGWKEEVPLEEGLEELYKWIKSRL